MSLTRFNHRFDPFTGVLSPLSIVDESHTVPAGAPYYIQLEEVPDQDTPSTVTIAGFTEVNVAPAASEFQVDYQYKTGLIRFNSADASTAVLVTYQGTGSPTLAEDMEKAMAPDHNFAQTAGLVTTATAAWTNDTGITVTVPRDSVIFGCYCGTIIWNAGTPGTIGQGYVRLDIAGNFSLALTGIVVLPADAGLGTRAHAFNVYYAANVAAGTHTIRGQYSPGLVGGALTIGINDRHISALAFAR